MTFFRTIGGGGKPCCDGHIKIDALNYYGATKKYHLHFPALREDIEADVVIIGSLKCLITARRAGVEYRPEE
jgi:hypothetical protein